MCDKLAILKTVENDPFLRFQMIAKEMFNRQQSLFHIYGIRKD